MRRYKHLGKVLIQLALCFGITSLPAQAAGTDAKAATQVKVTGEVIDTWCYFSGVMGSPDAVVGSAHHTCALWCAAGGIPVGMLADDGTVYMILKWQDDDALSQGTAILDVQSARITAEGQLHERDGIKYLIVEDVVTNEGIVNLNHEDYGTVPHFAIPDPNK